MKAYSMFEPLNYMQDHNHEQLVTCFDRQSGLRAFIGVHNTTLGPGLGGVRLWKYDSTEAAIKDVLRLSEGMSYKSAVAGLPLGGGKAVILADGREKDPAIRSARFRALGRYVERLNGCYIAAEDVGTIPQDMIDVRRETSHVVGLPPEMGGAGDPSPATARGVFMGIRAAVAYVLGKNNLQGVHVAIQGLGKVGMLLAEHLLEVGARVTATDISAERRAVAKNLGMQVVDPHAIYSVACDVFAPCALGAILNDITIPKLECKIVAGPANNQLAEPHHIHAMEKRGITYVVDYVVNAGGVIWVCQEAVGMSEQTAYNKIDTIYHTVENLLKTAEMEGVSTLDAAQHLANLALEGGALVTT